MTRRSTLERAGHALVQASAWPGRVAAWLVLPMIALVLVAVVGSLMKWGQLASWEADLPLFGSELTLTGLAELQWHLQAIIVMLGVSYALARDAHVKVDMLSVRFTPRGKALVDLLGDLVFLLPFCAIIGWLSLGFVEFSYSTGERSDYGGLTDRYLVKSILPIGFVVLALCGVGRVLLHLGVLFGGGDRPHD
ncbi:tripartite ATP-independent periplasmic transporters, DctQ component [Roseovarius sp. A-2]|uniref:TRAP transporter small permease subunit n=1 Tax=Roseovarius sp. A-2 TaxID=1570360 RepID=UPI0009B54BF5|nr:TRAP transporter small permease subunit [Roseovarius sp. A-2]GAW33124.1 tripartite ATP-independent periplasmic transporters, DctQ component [Roseovarius sp. A-2]